MDAVRLCWFNYATGKMKSYGGRGQEMLQLCQEERISDREKFRCVYQQYARLANHIAFGILKHKEDAEDAVQETFIRIVKNISKISDPFCPETKNFVVIICKNVSMDMLKKRKRSKVEELADYIPDERHEGNPDEMGSANEIIRIVVDTILELPERYRDCMYMELVIESDYKEIASLLKLKPETVRKCLQRGKKLLRKKLEERGD